MLHGSTTTSLFGKILAALAVVAAHSSMAAKVKGPPPPPTPIQPYVVTFLWDRGGGYFTDRSVKVDSNRLWQSEYRFTDLPAGMTAQGPSYCPSSKGCKPSALIVRDTYNLYSACSIDDATCYRDGPPVLFVHGFAPSSDAIRGGGQGTWGDLPRLISEAGYVPFEYRWNTATRFEDAAQELERAIDLIYSKTGERVHVIAHSFGGVLLRTLLQGISVSQTDRPIHAVKMSLRIASAATIGSPQSGIFDHLSCRGSTDAFPDGQDASALGVEIFPLCKQLSCQEAGQAVLNSYDSGFFGVSPQPGQTIQAIADTTTSPLPPVHVLSLIGLTTWRRDDGSVVDEGDALITFEGQRFLPNDSIDQSSLLQSCSEQNLRPRNPAWPLRDRIALGQAVITEKILGFPPETRPGQPNPVAGDGGYRHNTAVCAGTSNPLATGFFQECENQQPPAEAYVVCAATTDCEHATLQALLNWLPFITPPTIYRLTVTGTIQYRHQYEPPLPMTESVGDSLTVYWDIDTSTPPQAIPPNPGSPEGVSWQNSVVRFGYRTASSSAQHSVPYGGAVEASQFSGDVPKYSVLGWVQTSADYTTTANMVLTSVAGTSLDSIIALDPTPLSKWASSFALYYVCPAGGTCSAVVLDPLSMTMTYEPLR